MGLCLSCFGFRVITTLNITGFKGSFVYTCIVGPLRLSLTTNMMRAYLHIFDEVNEI